MQELVLVLRQRAVRHQRLVSSDAALHAHRQRGRVSERGDASCHQIRLQHESSSKVSAASLNGRAATVQVELTEMLSASELGGPCEVCRVAPAQLQHRAGRRCAQPSRGRRRAEQQVICFLHLSPECRAGRQQ